MARRLHDMNSILEFPIGVTSQTVLTTGIILCPCIQPDPDDSQPEIIDKGYAFPNNAATSVDFTSSEELTPSRLLACVFKLQNGLQQCSASASADLYLVMTYSIA